MSCSTAVLYSVCKPDISETSKSEPVYAVLATVSSEHTQQRIWMELANCRVLFITTRRFTRHTLDVQPSNCECSSQHHKQPQQVMVSSLFLLSFYLLWDNFLISEMASIHVNNTTKKTPCQPQSVQSLGMLTTENVTLPQLRDFRLQTRCIWDLHSFGILRSVDW